MIVDLIAEGTIVDVDWEIRRELETRSRQEEIEEGQKR